MRIFYLLFWLIIILLTVSFTVLNAHVVTVDWYFHQSTIFLPLLLLIVLVFGILLGILAMLPISLRHKAKARRLKHQLKDKTKELDNLRVMPINDKH